MEGKKEVKEECEVKKYKLGYTQGVYDMFHIGHLNLLNNAKKLCEFLIVGINTDELVENYKNKKPIIEENERKTIVENIKAVDQCILVSTLDKTEIHKKIPFDAIFIGDDWKGNERWRNTEKELALRGAEVYYIPHTKGISSTQLRLVEDERVGGLG